MTLERGVVMGGLGTAAAAGCGKPVDHIQSRSQVLDEEVERVSD